MALRIDLNCDMGESFGVWKLGNDEGIMPYVSSANIACGFHGGDPATMRKTVAAALKHGVALGAHPGLPDLQGFGRRNNRLNGMTIDSQGVAGHLQCLLKQTLTAQDPAPLALHIDPLGRKRGSRLEHF